MPTANPRVNVTLSPSTDALVIRLASLQRVSKSQVLRELLEAAEPALQRAAALMEAASGAQRAVLDELAQSLDRAQNKAEAALARTLLDSDRITADLVTQAEAVRGRRPARDTRSVSRAGRGGGGAQAAPNPPASNRGVKSRKTVPSSNVGRKK